MMERERTLGEGERGTDGWGGGGGTEKGREMKEGERWGLMERKGGTERGREMKEGERWGLMEREGGTERGRERGTDGERDGAGGGGD